jgi:hypothetical protein
MSQVCSIRIVCRSMLVVCGVGFIVGVNVPCAMIKAELLFVGG